MLDSTLGTIRRVIPRPVFSFFQPAYHFSLAFLAALVYGFPSRKIKVIAVTGTKGKSSTVEILNCILEAAGYKTAVSNTIRIKVAGNSKPNLYKMSMPGRFAIQRWLRKAVREKCKYAIVEMTSQGALLFRHRFISLDALIFTNVSPEHLEAHGSYENYINSKVAIARQLSRSRKANRAIIANADDPESRRFLECNAEQKITFSAESARPYEIKREGLTFKLNGKTVHSPLAGLFNLYNILGAAAAAGNQGIRDEVIVRAVEKLSSIPGRVQKISDKDVTIIIDYAHTPDSLQKLYEIFKDSRTICVLGGTGGGRDVWKRSEMGRVADTYCHEIILTNEDPYDEDPGKIVADVSKGIVKHPPNIIMDRREAIREAYKRTRPGDVVLITGKGTDPYIMGPKGSKIPWSDAEVAHEEMEAD